MYVFSVTTSVTGSDATARSMLTTAGNADRFAPNDRDQEGLRGFAQGRPEAASHDSLDWKFQCPLTWMLELPTIYMPTFFARRHIEPAAHTLDGAL